MTVAGGKITTSEGSNLDSEADDTIVDVAANPAPNTSFEGKLEGIGDSFRIVVNEQTTSGGSITVNAVHMYLLGPTAVGEAIIGQSRCGATATTGGGGGGPLTAHRNDGPHRQRRGSLGGFRPGAGRGRIDLHLLVRGAPGAPEGQTDALVPTPRAGLRGAAYGGEPPTGTHANNQPGPAAGGGGRPR